MTYLIRLNINISINITVSLIKSILGSKAYVMTSLVVSVGDLFISNPILTKYHKWIVFIKRQIVQLLVEKL